MKALYKSLGVLALCLCAGLSAVAQSGNVSPGKVGFTPMFVKTSAAVPQAAVDMMEQKLMQVAMRNGVGSYSGRYVLTAKVTEEDSQTTATAPVQYVKKLAVQFLAIDMQTHTVVGEVSVSVTGVDKSPERATMAALRNVQPKTAKMTAFIQNASTTIVDAFNRNLDNLLKTTDFLAGQRKFDEALARLGEIPENVDRYDEVLAVAEKICVAKAEDERKKAEAAAAAAEKQRIRDSIALAQERQWEREKDSLAHQRAKERSEQEHQQRMAEADKALQMQKAEFAKEEMKAAMEKEQSGEARADLIAKWKKWLEEN